VCVCVGVVLVLQSEVSSCLHGPIPLLLHFEMSSITIKGSGEVLRSRRSSLSFASKQQCTSQAKRPSQPLPLKTSAEPPQSYQGPLRRQRSLSVIEKGKGSTSTLGKKRLERLGATMQGGVASAQSSPTNVSEFGTIKKREEASNNAAPSSSLRGGAAAKTLPNHRKSQSGVTAINPLRPPALLPKTASIRLSTSDARPVKSTSSPRLSNLPRPRIGSSTPTRSYSDRSADQTSQTAYHLSREQSMHPNGSMMSPSNSIQSVRARAAAWSNLRGL
jgi:hypothetical protein